MVVYAEPNARRRALIAVCVLTALCLGAWRTQGVARELKLPRSLRASRYVGSQQCKRCHAEHYASWHRTFHRTMTQEASAQSVLGPFGDDARGALDYLGVRARMQHGPARGPDESSGYRIEFSNASGERWQAQVVRTVGSHRFQQYLGKQDDVYFRLPIAWDVQAQRFIHMNGAFLTPDPLVDEAGGHVSRVDYDRHVTRWNDNCVFCHNVHPNPALDRAQGTFATQVAELGVACEACHGPGAEHVAHNRDPLRRYALHLTGARDTTIRNPARMPPERSAEVCGRCHGQRITGDIARFHAHGDPFIPGEELRRYSRPLARDTSQNGQAGVFTSRFWPDGTPRLTAYEYQGYLQSPCRRGGKLSCESCHAMHRGDPSGQLQPNKNADELCTACHTQLASAVARAKHAKHSASGSGAHCAGCHMPDIVYGLVSVHLSHRIELPAVSAQSEPSRPDACTLCHVDRSRRWASDAMKTPGAASTATPNDLPAMTEALLGGDPIERAVAAHALGRDGARYAPEYLPQLLGLLCDTLEADAYPAVRSIAARSLQAVLRRTHPALAKTLDAYVATDAQSARSQLVAALRTQLGDRAVLAPELALRTRLRARAATTAIEIGE